MEVQQKSEYDYCSVVEDLQRQNRLHEAIAFGSIPILQKHHLERVPLR